MKSIRSTATVVLLFCLVWVGCASKPVRWARDTASVVTNRITGRSDGQASWYGEKFHGRPTASGETFDQNALTAAHRNLPFGSVVGVTNMRNGKSVKVRINDRGPFVRGRVIDLSRRAADQIGMITAGVVPVRLKVIRRGPG
jgi:rare lipoprotein A